MGATTDGHPLIQFTRANVDDDGSKNFFLVAETDGPIRSALMSGAFDPTCNYGFAGAQGDHYVWTNGGDYPRTDDHTYSEGFVGGVLDERVPSVNEADQSVGVLGYGYIVGQNFLARELIKTEVQPWGSTDWLTAYDPAADPDPAPVNWITMNGDDVFTEVGASTDRGVSVWSKAGGQRRLLIDPTEKTDRRAFATDGKDMVWDQGETDLDPDLGIYNGGGIMTAPYTTDPAVVVKTTRRIRTDESLIGGNRFQVGCGYAARTTSSGPLYDGLTIVRLADGTAWQFAGTPLGSDFAYIAVLWVTCDEVFVFVGGKVLGGAGTGNVIRLRLDSLGDGIPSDITSGAGGGSSGRARARARARTGGR